MIARANDISILYIRNLIGHPSTDLGTLCSSPKINKWSKYKPVRNNFTFTRPIYWWMAADGKCGIDFTVFTSMNAMFTAAASGADMYAYMPPRGGASEPFRAGDFANYFTKATPPIEAGAIQGIQYQNYGVQVFAHVSTEYPYNLSISDVYGASINNFYYGCAVRRVGQTVSSYMTESAPMTTTGGGGITFPGTNLTAGYKYEVIQFLAENRKTNPSDPDIVNSFVLIPSTVGYIQTIELQSAAVRYNIYADMDISGNISVYYTVQNQSSTTVTTINPHVILRYGDNITGSMVVGEGSFSLPVISVGAGSTGTSAKVTVSGYLPEINTRNGYAQFYENSVMRASGFVGFPI